MAARQRKKQRKRPIDFDQVGQSLAKLIDVKQQLIEASIACGDRPYARRFVAKIRTRVRLIREGLETGLREGDLGDLTPELAQQAIYGCQILESTLQIDPEHRH
jgi:hypothetical protein